MTGATLLMSLVGEFLGTYLLVLAIFASGGSPIVIGLTLALIVFLISGVSGANVNPAVSLAALLNGFMDGTKFISYVVVQLAGGAAAYYTYQALM
jgi:glycerol uptake facilitator-like aquaporin